MIPMVLVITKTKTSTSLHISIFILASCSTNLYRNTSESEALEEEEAVEYISLLVHVRS